MKLAIFGDSFAEKTKCNPTTTWWEFLQHSYDVHNFAHGGTNLWYSAKKILDFGHNFDQIIWITTEPGRLIINDFENIFDLKYGLYERIVNLSSAEQALKKLDLEQDNLQITMLKKIYNSSLDYFTYIQNYNYECYIGQLLIEDIKNKFPNIIIVPAFSYFIDKNQSHCLSDIFLMESKAMGISNLSNFDYDYDLRNNHMLPINHEILYKKVLTWLNNQPVKIDLNDFYVPNLEDRKSYIVNNE